ncbi:hypothetical protein [Hoylesella nanceiensis]|jgi:hypothetical protein|uniref:Uncharacterized protein n=1 Tax=Hoylesella nanceiensis TaxID=425941 RepID=A0ABS6YE73_9BACT|nr:hypothetical protein [Hoylesella nanceiensis]MBW4769024.1 hypothetical protein [Hoylesella nanceiensis]
MNDLKVRLKAEIMSYFDECEVSIFAVAGANYYETLGRCIKGFCVLSNILDVFNRSRMRKTDVLRLCYQYCVCARWELLCAVNGSTDIKTSIINANSFCEKALSILCD